MTPSGRISPSNIEEAFHRLFRMVWERALRGVERSPLNLAQCRALRVVCGCDRVTMSELCRALDKPPSTMTHIVAGLVREGLVTQRRDVRRDQRVVFVRATAGGRRRWATIEAAPRQLLKEMFGSLSAGDRGHLARILQELMPAGTARCEVRAEEKRPHA